MKIKLLLISLLALATFVNQSMADKLPAAVIQQKKYSKLIVGKWQGDKGLVLTFSADGSYSIDSDGPFRVVHEKARWRIENNQLIIDFDNGSHVASQIEYVKEASFALDGRHHHDVYDRISP